MKTTSLIILLLFLSTFSHKVFSSLGDENLDLYEATPFNEQLTLKEKNRSLGLITSYDILTDSTLWTFSIHGNTNLSGMTDLLTLQVNYLKNLNHFWFNSFLASTNTTFETISHTNNGLDPSDPIEKTAKQNLLSFGAGIGYRMFWIQQLFDSIFNTRDIYEFTTASLTYHTLKEGDKSENYKGLGLQTEFTIVKRLSPSYHLGLKTSYNISSVKRKVPEDSSSSANSMVISWLSFALELGLYF